MKKYLIFLFLAFTFSGTIFGQMPQIEAGVSKELAKWRAENYSDVKFRLDMTLEKMSPTIKGAVEISLFNKADLIILDWRKLKGKEDLSKLANLSVNGKTAYFEEIEGHLVLKEGVLKNKSNAIRFDFTTPVADDAGIKRFVDKADGAEYVYSQFSADKNTPFPVFDQPDLKARFQLHLVVPEKWNAVSNEEIVKTGFTTLDEKPFPPGQTKSRPGTLYIFSETEAISVYVFAFAAGEFTEFNEFSPKITKNELKDFYRKWGDNRRPLKIYVRKSQAEKFKTHAAEVFKLNNKTDKSAKLDIILLPETVNVQSEYDGVKFVPESSVFR